MQAKTTALALIVLLVVLAPSALAGGAGSPSPAQPAQEAMQLRVALGKSLIVNSPDPLKRVAISVPDVATAILISESQVLIHGNTPGTVSLIFWDQLDRPQTFELSVVIELAPLRETFKQVLPKENIQVTQSGGSLVLTGIVSSDAAAEQLTAVAQTQIKNVVNLLEVEENRDTILLQVRFAEVDRRFTQELGINFLSTGAANTPGVISTQQFGGLSGNLDLSGTIGAPMRGYTTELELSDVLNIFLFRPDLNLGVAIKALENRNWLEILAEPNLLAKNGAEASFLAGGEFPFPIIQGGTNNAITIQFKEFGVRLNFTPTIMPDGKIRLKVAPEVSSLDYSNAVTLEGFTIPALSTRRAETEVELLDGQSFAVAGLIDNRLIELANKIPFLGDIPFIGKLFRSRSMNKTNSELLVMVTPTVVHPLNPDELPEGPAFPKPFLNPDKFDNKKPPATTEGGGE